MNEVFLICAVALVAAFNAGYWWRAWWGGLGRYFAPGQGRPFYLRKPYLAGLGLALFTVLYLPAIWSAWALWLAAVALVMWTLPHAPGISLGRMPVNLDRDKWAGWLAYPLASLFGNWQATGTASAARWAAAYLAVNYGLRTAVVWLAGLVPGFIHTRLILGHLEYLPALPVWYAFAGMVAAPAYVIGWALWDRGGGIRGDNPSDQGGMHSGEAINGGLWAALTMLAAISVRV